jgi:enamine deaminase RidA (YjgF/YER057c/UK114 family)
MKNSKLVEEAKQNPTRIYHRPHDVLRDRRLDDAARLEILDAWSDRLRSSEPAPNGVAAELEQLQAARIEVEQRLPGQQAAE